MPTLSQAIADAVERDGLPRHARDETGAVHVLYLEGHAVRSMLAADWPPPLPAEPSEAESTAAIAARQVAASARTQALAARDARLKADAAGAIGKDVATLRQPELNALLALVLERLGALGDDGKVRPFEVVDPESHRPAEECSAGR